MCVRDPALADSNDNDDDDDDISVLVVCIGGMLIVTN